MHRGTDQIKRRQPRYDSGIEQDPRGKPDDVSHRKEGHSPESERGRLPSGHGHLGREGIRFRANQNAVPQGSHQNWDLIIPSPAITWPPGFICALRHEGHRRSWITGNSGSGGMAPDIPMLTSMMASDIALRVRERDALRRALQAQAPRGPQRAWLATSDRDHHLVFRLVMSPSRPVQKNVPL